MFLLDFFVLDFESINIFFKIANVFFLGNVIRDISNMASLVIFRFETFCLGLGDDGDDGDNMRSMGDGEDGGMMLGDVKIFIYFWLMMGDIDITFGTLPSGQRGKACNCLLISSCESVCKSRGSCILDTHCHRLLRLNNS